MENSLRKLRKAAGYKSAKDFAQAIDMPYTTYSKYETTGGEGELFIPLKAAWAIADKLGCTIDAVVGRDEIPEEGISGAMQLRVDALPPEAQSLVEDFVAMLEGRELRARQDRLDLLAAQYHRDARRLELEYLESLEESGRDFIDLGGEEDLRGAFMAFAAARIAEEESRRSKLRKAAGGEEDPQDDGAPEAGKGALEGIMAAYDRMHPPVAGGTVEYAFMKLPG